MKIFLLVSALFIALFAVTSASPIPDEDAEVAIDNSQDDVRICKQKNFKNENFELCSFYCILTNDRKRQSTAKICQSVIQSSTTSTLTLLQTASKI